MIKVTALLPGVVPDMPFRRNATELEKLIEKFISAKGNSEKPLPPSGYENPMTNEEKCAYDILVKALDNLAAEMNRLNNNIPDSTRNQLLGSSSYRANIF